MSHLKQTHIFWGAHAPLSSLTGGALLIIGSVRTAYAIISLCSLVWVYGLTIFIASAAKPILPRGGKSLLFVFLSSLLGGLFLLVMFFLNPILAGETAILVLLTQITCIGSGLCQRLDFLDPAEALGRAFLEALILGLLIIAFALIREPAGFGSLSIPGGIRGFITLFNGEGRFFPLQVISSSSGALILLGYGLAVFHWYKNHYSHPEDDAE
jgi:hypothetical protein